MPRAEAIIANIERRVDHEAERISAVLEWWLSEEANRVSDNNAYLDDFAGFEEELHEASEYGSGFRSAKAQSHYDRLIAWTNQTQEREVEVSDEDYDYLLARQLFGTMMLLSGNLRKQALISASGQEEYTKYRRDSTLVGADLQTIVRDRVWWHRAVKEQLMPEQEKEELFANTLRVNDAGFTWTGNFIFSRGQHESGRQDTETLALAHMTEQALIELAVDYIFYMDARNFELGRTRGYDGFANVPFLEPKSITLDPQIIHPFAAAA